MTACDRSIRAALLKQGYDVPVIDTVPMTVLIAAALVDLGLSQSKTTYPTPREKPVAGFDLPSLRKPAAAE